MSGNATEPAAELRAIVIRRKKTDDPPLTIWGIETLERQKRCAEALGASRCDILDAGEYPPLNPGDARYLVLRADLVYEERLLQGLVEAVLDGGRAGWTGRTGRAGWAGGAGRDGVGGAIYSERTGSICKQGPEDAKSHRS